MCDVILLDAYIYAPIIPSSMCFVTVFPPSLPCYESEPESICPLLHPKVLYANTRISIDDKFEILCIGMTNESNEPNTCLLCPTRLRTPKQSAGSLIGNNMNRWMFTHYAPYSWLHTSVKAKRNRIYSGYNQKRQPDTPLRMDQTSKESEGTSRTLLKSRIKARKSVCTHEKVQVNRNDWNATKHSPTRSLFRMSVKGTQRLYVFFERSYNLM